MQPIQYQTDLTPYNTFGLRAKAQAFIALEHADELRDIVRLPEFDRNTVLWLGGGSNILLMQDYTGLVVHMENKGIREIARSDDLVYIEAQAGEIWHDFVLHTIALGLNGLENLSLIPGTVGASPVQNIGAYGVEAKDVIHSVRCFDLDTETFVELSNADCRFAYRESLFKQEGKGRYVIVSVVFALKERFEPNLGYGDLAVAVAERSAGRVPTAKDVSDAVCANAAFTPISEDPTLTAVIGFSHSRHAFLNASGLSKASMYTAMHLVFGSWSAYFMSSQKSTSALLPRHTNMLIPK